MKRRRLKPAVRRQEILDAALPLAVKYQYDRITRDQIGDAAGCSGQSVQYHFSTMLQLRRTIMRMAVRTECLAVIAQGLARGDTQARQASKALQDRAADSLRPGR